MFLIVVMHYSVVSITSLSSVSMVTMYVIYSTIKVIGGHYLHTSVSMVTMT